MIDGTRGQRFSRTGVTGKDKPGRNRRSNFALRAEITFPELVGRIAKLMPSGCQVKVVSFVNLENLERETLNCDFLLFSAFLSV